MSNIAEVKTDDGSMLIYRADPEGQPKGAVIVIQEAFGVNDHIEDVARRFADAGYLAVAPHVFHRSGDPVLGYDEISKVMPHMQAVTQTGLQADIEATLDYVAAAGIGRARVGVVGFCMGGSVAFYTAVKYPLGAGVSFYGGGVGGGRFGFPSQVELAPQLQAPWLGLYGDRDQSIPVEEVESLRLAASKAGVPTEVVRYVDAEHGFHCDARPSYHEASAQDAWRRTLEWFATHLAAA
jgi:carboxymethylenebutenolidase